LFHQEHAFVMPHPKGYLHGNSLHRAEGSTGFMASETGDVLFSVGEKLLEFGYYPHRRSPSKNACECGFSDTDDVSATLAATDFISQRIDLRMIRRYKAA
jgi:hypothetical protein